MLRFELIKVFKTNCSECIFVMTGNTAGSVASVAAVVNNENAIADRLVPADAPQDFGRLLGEHAAHDECKVSHLLMQ